MNTAASSRKRVSKTPMAIGCFAVASLLLAMSGACSQHQPGAWELGGRSFEVPQLQGTITQDAGGDNFVPDNFVPDNFVVDTGGGG